MKTYSPEACASWIKRWLDAAQTPRENPFTPAQIHHIQQHAQTRGVLLPEGLYDYLRMPYWGETDQGFLVQDMEDFEWINTDLLAEEEEMVGLAANGNVSLIICRTNGQLESVNLFSPEDVFECYPNFETLWVHQIRLVIDTHYAQAYGTQYEVED